MTTMLIAQNETRESGSFMGDCDYFGVWLSGFTDGEGCFRLDVRGAKQGFTPRASFHIGLRADDTEILKRIQSYLGCGIIRYNAGDKKSGNPQSRFVVSIISELWTIVVPHFDRFPLLAKKKADFDLWRKGVEIIHRVTSIPMKSCGIYGRLPRWTNQNKQEFYDIQDALEQQRVYRDQINDNYVDI